MMDDPRTAADEASQPAPWVFDVLLGMGVTLVVSLFIAADIEGADPDAWSYLWAVGLGGLMLVRRRYPVLVVVLSAGAVLSYYAAGYPAIGVAVPLAAAAFSAAEFGRMGAAVISSASVLVISVVYRLAIDQDPAVVVGYELPGHALLLGAAIAFGDSLRARRALRTKSVEIAGLLAERYAREAQQRVMSERLAIARELHDSVGHALTAIALHTQIAEEALDTGDEVRSAETTALHRALQVITETTSATFEDLRRTVASLRSEGAGSREALRITDLDSAVLPARQAGVDVDTLVDVRSPLPPTLESAIYRIVQESITNVVRHADASRVDVRVQQVAEHIDVTIVNDDASAAGRAPRRARETGSGLAGMRERATLLGGTFTAGFEDDGFVVRASIPLEVIG
ncbi:MAG TPA: sensor histidine kinase [Microbacterium sp.]|nr:sensor histidine kinase [Microbacterium sp.]